MIPPSPSVMIVSDKHEKKEMRMLIYQYATIFHNIAYPPMKPNCYVMATAEEVSASHISHIVAGERGGSCVLL